MKVRIKNIVPKMNFTRFTSVRDANLITKTSTRIKVCDFTLPELLDLSQHFDPLTNQRSKQVIGSTLRLLMLNRDLDLVFHIRSAQPGGPIYTQLVRFYDIYEKSLNLKEIDGPEDLSERLKEGEVGVWCSDPSFQYWGPAWNATRTKYNIIAETRAPKEPNKARKEEFVLCKHLIVVLKYLEDNWNYVIENYWNLLYRKNRVLSKEERERNEKDQIRRKRKSKKRRRRIYGQSDYSDWR